MKIKEILNIDDSNFVGKMNLDYRGCIIDSWETDDIAFIDGDLILTESDIYKMPKKLTVTGYVWMNDCTISAMPEELIVSKSLFIQNSILDKTKCKKITVKEDIIARHIRCLNCKLADTLDVNGNIYVSGMDISEINLDGNGKIIGGFIKRRKSQE